MWSRPCRQSCSPARTVRAASSPRRTQERRFSMGFGLRSRGRGGESGGPGRRRRARIVAEGPEPGKAGRPTSCGRDLLRDLIGRMGWVRSNSDPAHARELVSPGTGDSLESPPLWDRELVRPNPSPRSRMTPRRALWGLIVVSGLLRLAWAASLGPCNDEAYHYLFTVHPDWSYFDHPPMLAIVERIGLALPLGGVSAFRLRLGFIALFA